ncbi:MAG: hypothetical protein H8D67_29990 [Deltaproteobacteria bacterium]|nr:hypothetical protein [Deltaproteobacteria bacterium]
MVFILGPAFNQAVHEADSLLISAEGIALNSSFLSKVAANPDKGVILIESTASTAYPLELQVVSNGTVLVSAELPLRTSSVEFMFHHKNLRPDGDGMPDRDGAVAINEPPSNGTNLIFVHGANVDEMSARGWQSEFFKRLWWSGSKARFHGVTWRGDMWSSANYQENVNEAFETAPYLSTYVTSLGGPSILLAHSLGNMVVSSAIEDCGMSVSKYLMLDAAVAAEAFDASMFNVSTNSNPMLHAAFREYEPKTWSANFHELYSSPDMREKLTWKNRFASVVPLVYNFYSSEDEVFEINLLSVGPLTGVEFDLNIWPFNVDIHGLSRYSWQKQEVLKGRDSSWLLGSLGSTKWWGWGFEKNWLGQEIPSTIANNLTEDQLCVNPVFRHNVDSFIYTDDFPVDDLNKMLAMGLPAMSPSVGQTNIATILPAKNINISALKENEWPRNEQPYLQRWLHSDCKDVAYLYTHRLFEELTAKGVLK